MASQVPMRPLFTLHPWHGIEIGAQCPEVVTAFIEIVPTDVVKYEIDKVSGHLKVDRPHKYSSQCPALYGFVPQTLCADEVGALAAKKMRRNKIRGDGDPLDICVFSERPIQHGGVIVQAKPIGGLRLLDRNEADDKIIAVLVGDGAYGDWNDISDIPLTLRNRIQHYFLTYKHMPDQEPRKVEIAATYGRKEAYEVIRLSQKDYAKDFLSS